ncbi:hypothetical protein SAMN04488490_3461 [Marinobacter sp. LV10R510-11A]|uniref:DUF4123 domain-containing protein n=1 Tax=Marinobacter sp. LV10R510-11A TaxID=1415568 RepID=UPI000BBF4E85|nr:DUF4123 domain-containing protein [Marinobacter sp. LV10R510-11A]SOB77637.1 hypothetical protein SAMN04488490_3461 [Marinobacter sp. LV10R510-11A]
MTDSTALSQKAHTTTSFYQHADPSSEEACGYLVDQAKHPEVLRLLFEHDPVPIYDLPYIYSEYREQAFDGPLIIQPTTAQSEEWLQTVRRTRQGAYWFDTLKVLATLSHSQDGT